MALVIAIPRRSSARRQCVVGNNIGVGLEILAEVVEGVEVEVAGLVGEKELRRAETIMGVRQCAPKQYGAVEKIQMRSECIIQINKIYNYQKPRRAYAEQGRDERQRH